MQVDPVGPGAEDLGEESQQLGVLRLFFQVLIFLVGVATLPNFKDVEGGKGRASQSLPGLKVGGIPGRVSEAFNDKDVGPHLSTLLIRQIWQHQPVGQALAMYSRGKVSQRPSIHDGIVPMQGRFGNGSVNNTDSFVMPCYAHANNGRVSAQVGVSTSQQVSSRVWFPTQGAVG